MLEDSSASEAADPTASLPWREIATVLEEAVVATDSQDCIVWLNRAAATLFDCEVGETLPRPLEQCGALARAFAVARECQPGSCRFELARNGEHPHHLELTLVVSGDGAGATETLIARDQSNMRRMEQALVHSQKNQAIGALASGIAHDFNNILTAVLSQLDLAIYSPDLPASIHDNLVQAQTSGRRAAELIARLRTFSRDTPAERTTIDLAQVVEQVMLILRRGIDRRIEIVTGSPEPGRRLVEADGSQMMQMVLNLCLNARDAMPEGGRLEVHIADSDKDPDKVLIRVSDTGEGIPQRIKDRLFEPYFTTRQIGRGTGLGLSIVQNIVEDYGGAIEVESEPGRGSTFTVTLPRARAQQAQSSSLHEFTANESRALEGSETILVADDEEMVRMVLRAVLAYRGYQIVEAVDGEDAVQKCALAEKPFDLVLLDVDMPRLNGWDALKLLHESRPEIPVVMLSGGVVENDAEGALGRGAAGFLPKPFKNDKLIQLVRRILDERRKG